jgi:TPR repeat protein
MYKKDLMSKHVNGLKAQIAKLESEKKMHAKLFKIMQDAAEKGSTKSSSILGYLYAHENDIENAFKYLKIASDKGSAQSHYNLGVIYYHKFNDIENAIKYFKLAKEKGYKKAQNALDIITQNSSFKNDDDEKSEKQDEISLKRKCENESILILTNDTKRAKLDVVMQYTLVNKTDAISDAIFDVSDISDDEYTI